jgi:hypothetical protein
MKNNLIEPQKGKQMAEGRKEEYEYLQATVSAGQLSSFPPERNEPTASTVSSNKVVAARASTTAQTLQALCGQRCDTYYHSGINE